MAERVGGRLLRTEPLLDGLRLEVPSRVSRMGDKEVSEGDYGVVVLLVCHRKGPLRIEPLKGESLDEIGAAHSPVTVNLETWDVGFYFFCESRMDG
jgi:hypothetical protein